MTDYPKAFFIVHKRFGSLGWGDVGDGPVLEEDLTDVLIEAWKYEDRDPDRDDFRVWGIALGRSEDRTAWALRNMIETRKERQ
jgi:hypothetical protein